MVNSEEGFGNLSRFLYGDIRVDGSLTVRELGLPPALQREKDSHPALKINASYSFESYLRVRGENWAMTERLVQNGSAAFRRYDELLGKNDPADMGLSEKQQREKKWNKSVELFSAFLDTKLRIDPTREEKVQGIAIKDTMGFALRLRVAVPDYEVNGRPWRVNHYEGSSLLDQDFVFLAFEEEEGNWGLAWGVNRPDSSSDDLEVVQSPAEDARAEDGATAFRRKKNGTLQFWLPIQNIGQPIFRAWLRLTARLVSS